MKRELFFLVLLIIAGLLWQYSKTFNTEGFQEPELVIPKPNPQATPISDGDPQPFAPPSTSLLAPPPGQTASVNSYPDEDPSQKKAPLKRLSNTLETLNGFLNNEGPGLAKIGDPSVQLPLETAHADARRIQDEINVLGRNPGVESSLTSQDIDQIEANMRYLQKKWRLSANSMSGAPKAFSEGFTGDFKEGFGWFNNSNNSHNSNNSNNSHNSNNSNNSNRHSSDLSDNISIAELNTLQVNLNSTIVRLSSSGSTSSLLNKRIDILQTILDYVNGYIAKIRSGEMEETDIPIRKSDYDKFLPFVTAANGAQLNKPLPDLLHDRGANAALANLFPNYFDGDLSGASLAKYLFDKYAPDFFKNVSYDLNLKLSHKTDAENAVAEQIARAFANSVLPPFATSEDGTNGSAPSTGDEDRGELESKVKQLFNDNKITVSGNGTSGDNSKVPGYSSTATTFVWKDRADQICQQISKRGLNPDDYGCLKNSDDLSENFSYRGYTRMICTRLATNYDPSIPDLCGCPPLTWSGWRL